MEPIIASILTGTIISIISGGIIAFLKRRWKKNDTDNNKKALEDLELKQTVLGIRKGQWRLEKTVLILAKIIDDQTAKNHPELTNSLEDIASELLKDANKG